MKLLLLAALVVGLGLLVITYEVLRLVPLVELRRRARADRHFHNLYQAASFGPALELVLALLISGGATSGTSRQLQTGKLRRLASKPAQTTTSDSHQAVL